MLALKKGQVVNILGTQPGLAEIVVILGDQSNLDTETQPAKAYNYDLLTGPVNVGDQVLLNTTAVELNLGSGGYHFVVANMSGGELAISGSGHIMKLNYTPLQMKVLSVEEEASPYHQIMEEQQTLQGCPVVIGTLHSMLAPAVAGIKARLGSAARVIYVMTDGAALPLIFSRTVQGLRASGLLDGAVTAGQAFGGDLEAVNIYTAMLAARTVLKADVIVVTMGPGIVGTGSTLGFSGIEQGEIINAVSILDGRAVAIPRISFADPRPRHRGLSHHTLTVLSRIALHPAMVSLPEMPDPHLDIVRAQILKTGLNQQHRFIMAEGTTGMNLLADQKFKVSSMGRGYPDDPEFFLAAAAAGNLAADLASGRVELPALM